MYHIIVGEGRPTSIKVGIVEANTGQQVIKEKGEKLARRGDCGFPNGTKIWAVRVIKNDKGEVTSKDERDNYTLISVTDPRYKGEIQRLKWGAPGGSLIDVRYLKAYGTLDLLYQDRILNFKIDDTLENSADVYMLMMPNGENDIDETIEPLLVEHLKAHPYNRDSISKDPQFQTFMFYEKSFDQEERLDSKLLDFKFEAGKIVREAAEGNTLEKCKILFSIIRGVADEEPEDNKMFAYLKMIADKKSVEFLKAIDDYKKNVSNVIAKGISNNVFDITMDGTISVHLKSKKPQTIISDIPAKGEDMYTYLVENFLDPAVFEATFNLIKITDKLN